MNADYEVLLCTGGPVHGSQLAIKRGRNDVLVPLYDEPRPRVGFIDSGLNEPPLRTARYVRRRLVTIDVLDYQP